MTKQSIQLDHLEIIGYADSLTAHVLPQAVPAVYRVKGEERLLIMPPYEQLAEEINCDDFSTPDDFQAALADDRATEIPYPITAKHSHQLWVDEDFIVQYNAKTSVDARLRELAKEYAKQAKLAITDHELDNALFFSQRAVSANELCLDAILTKALVHRLRGDETHVSILAEIAEDIAPDVDLISWVDLYSHEDPSESEMLTRKGEKKRHNGDYDGAIENYNSAMEAHDASTESIAQATICRGVVYYLKGDLDKAIADYDATLGTHDLSQDRRAQAHVNRGVARGVQGNIEGEIEDYLAALALKDAPEERVAKAYGNLGWAYYEQGKVIESIQASRSALDLDGDLYWVRANLALALLTVGDFEGAESEYTAAITEIEDPAELDEVVMSDLDKAMKLNPKIEGVESIVDQIKVRRRYLLKSK